MKKAMIWAITLVVLVAGMVTIDIDSAEAGLFGRRKKNKCCPPAPTCCEPAPTCCEPAPTCCEPAPAPCVVEATPACGCEVQTCACEETINCDCLNKRQLRRAQRKGQCCEVQTCGCEAPAPSCGCEPTCGCEPSCGCGETVIEGCSDCGSAPVELEAAPEEAAPEAPESDSTT